MISLRAHQRAFRDIAQRLALTGGIRDIYASVTPGGGKSALPGILAEALLGSVVDHILWVVPRNSLRDQGEADFPEWSRFRIRAAGNESDPCRGTDGYVTTYQAMVSNPARHLETVSRGRWAVLLDEPHHVKANGEWHRALAPVMDKAVLRVFMSGTFARGDGEPIAWLEYDGDGRPLFDRLPESAVVRYTRTDALREGAIVPIRFHYLDGRAEWDDEAGIRQEADLSSRDYTAQALFTALRTDYAYELLDEAVTAWKVYRSNTFPGAKLLVVAHDIEQAKLYQAHLHRQRIDALIATSEDDTQARDAIARFKGRAAPAVDALVTVAMAYEGLSVPSITHVACLTHIRSVPWLEQCFARANRTAPGKKEGFIYGPKDVRFLSAIRSIEAEQVLALKPAPESEEKAAREVPEFVEGTAKPWITPIGSEAYRAVGVELEKDERPDGGMTPKEAERLLRTQIADHIDLYLSRCRPGSKAAYSSIIHRKLKAAVGGKPREDCTVKELTKQWALLKEGYPV
jgi:superfamily II DNA or RNA helicase